VIFWTRRLGGSNGFGHPNRLRPEHRGTLTPVPTTTDIPGQPIPLGFGPGMQMMAVTPDGKTIYVTQGTGSVTPVSTVTNKAGKPIPVGQGSAQILITPDGKTAYVLNYWGPTLTPITTATNTAGKAINVGLSPRQADSMAMTPDGNTLYVLISFPDPRGPELGAAYLLPISTATNKPGRPIRIDMAFPGSIVISPDGKTAYVIGATTNGIPTSVIPVMTATNTPGPAVTIEGFAAYQAITPDGKTIYLATTGGMIPFATATDTPGKLIKINTQVWVTPDESALYVFSEPRATPGADNSCTNPGDVTRVPTIPGGVTRVPTVTNLPGGRLLRLPCIAWIFAVSRDGQTVWAAGGNTLTPISTATNTPGKPISLGAQIDAIVVTP
jgi:DNA-binding beta-propeller fold protein YncE